MIKKTLISEGNGTRCMDRSVQNNVVSKCRHCDVCIFGINWRKWGKNVKKTRNYYFLWYSFSLSSRKRIWWQGSQDSRRVCEGGCFELVINIWWLEIFQDRIKWMATHGPANHCIVLKKIILWLTSGPKFLGWKGICPPCLAWRLLPPCYATQTWH